MFNGRVVYPYSTTHALFKKYSTTHALIHKPTWYFSSRNNNLNQSRELWVCLNQLCHPRKCNSKFPLTQFRTSVYVQSNFINGKIPIDSSRKRKLRQRFQKYAMIQV
ncbi:hypothetical protein QL285_019724 [Trifolium repens]|nr:hypothetical protein QL285_019724 [Trifolium repens]